MEVVQLYVYSDELDVPAPPDVPVFARRTSGSGMTRQRAPPRGSPAWHRCRHQKGRAAGVPGELRRLGALLVPGNHPGDGRRGHETGGTNSAPSW